MIDAVCQKYLLANAIKYFPEFGVEVTCVFDQVWGNFSSIIQHDIHDQRLAASCREFNSVHGHKVAAQFLRTGGQDFLVVTPFVIQKIFNPVFRIDDFIRVGTLSFESSFGDQYLGTKIGATLHCTNFAPSAFYELMA